MGVRSCPIPFCYCNIFRYLTVICRIQSNQAVMYNTQEVKHISEYSQALGETVRAARELSLLQSQVASLIDADESTIMNIETYRVNTKIDVLYPLIRTLRIDPRDIFNPEISRECPEHYQFRTLIDYCSRQEAAKLFWYAKLPVRNAW